MPERAVLMLPIIAAVVAACTMWPVHVYAALIAGGVGLVSAAAVGVPALYWAVTHGRTKFHHLVILGALAGAVPVVVLSIVNVVGLLFADGSLPTPKASAVLTGLARLEIVPMSIGAVSGAIYWLVVVDRHFPRWAAWGLTALMLAAVASASAVLLGSLGRVMR
jgi:hypothetical protein